MNENPALEGVAAVVRVDGRPPMHARFLMLGSGADEVSAVAVPTQLPAGEHAFKLILPDRIRRTGRGVARPQGSGTILLGRLDEVTEAVEETEPPFPEREQPTS